MPRDLNIQIHFILCSLLAFFMPLLPIAMPLLIILLALNRIAYFRTIETKHDRSQRIILACFTGLYVAYLLGMLYTSNFSYGIKDLETKFSLLLLPLLFFFGWQADEARFRQVLWAFVWGCAVSAVYSYTSSYFDYVEGKEGEANKIPGLWNFGINHWLSSRLTKHFHPSYLSMYVNFAIMALFYVNGWPRRQLSAKHHALAVFLAIFVLFINAKSGLIFLLLLVMIYLYFLVFKMKKLRLAMMVIGGFVLTGAVLWFAAPEFAYKIKAAVNAMTGQGVNVKADDSSAARRIIWSASSEVIREHFPFGAGTGDAKDALLQQYREIGFEKGIQQNLNCHNQFLQTFVAVGLPALLLLSACIVYPAYTGARRKYYFPLLLALLFLVNFLTESMLETQAGVVFFAFIVIFFSYRSDPAKATGSGD